MAGLPNVLGPGDTPPLDRPRIGWRQLLVANGSGRPMASEGRNVKQDH